MTEREYDASVDLHDSYYAAVAELRQQHEAGLPAPLLSIKVEQAKADAIIQLAITLKDWPLVEQAIDLKIEQQAEFIGWWSDKIQPNRRPRDGEK